MLDYFNNRLAISKGRVIDPSFINIQRTVKKNLDIIQPRYIAANRAVAPTHLLIKVLAGLGLRMDLEGSALDYHVRERARAMAPALGVISPSSYGSELSGNFLQSATELVIFTYEPYVKTNWPKLAPVEYVYHTLTNTNYQLGSNDDSDEFAYIKVNVCMLAYQFVEWYKWKRANSVQENTYNFIARYPLFNSMKSYLDISLFNKHYYRIAGKMVEDDPRVRSFSYAPFEKALEKSNLKIIDALLSRGVSIGTALYSTPSFFKDSALDLTAPINTVTTNQIEWFLFVCRLPYIHYGLLLAYTSGSDLSQTHVGNLSREIRAFINNRTLSRVPKHTRVHIIDDYLENLLQLCGDLK